MLKNVLLSYIVYTIVAIFGTYLTIFVIAYIVKYFLAIITPLGN